MARARTESNTRSRKATAKARIDWTARPAPKKGSPLRARYERSAVFRQRQERARKGQATRHAVERAREALQELRARVDDEAPGDAIDDAADAWHDAKDALGEELDDYDQFLAILDELQEDEAPDWQIAYEEGDAA